MARALQSNHQRPRISRNKVLFLVLSVLVLYAVVPQFAGLKQAFHGINGIAWPWFGVAVAAAASTYVWAAAVYVLLAKHRLPYGRTTLVQLASMFANRLVPAGLGALGVNYEFLRRSKHTAPEALAAVSVNNALGFLGNMALLALLVLTTDIQPQKVHLPAHLSVRLGVVATMLVVSLLGGVWILYGKRLRRFISQTMASILSYHRQPGHVVGAVAFSLAVTASYTLCLAACLHAVGVTLPIGIIFVVMSLGVAGGTAVPTPGGIGGAEAGLVAGLLIYGVSTADAVAATLLYRLCTYWLALLLGASAFVVAGRRKYI